MTDAPTHSPPTYEPDEAFALHCDEVDSLRGYREQFHLPRGEDGEPLIYFCGNSLGLQPKGTRAIVEQELDDWAAQAVEAHFRGTRPWYPYHERFREVGARLVGARPGEIVMMNSLTVNLHLMMTSFFRPSGSRNRILMEWPVFPSDIYAIRSHLHARGLDPDDTLIIVPPRDGHHVVRHEDMEQTLKTQGDTIALVLLGGVNYYTGQVLDMQRITAAAHRAGCMIGFDLAHAAGNLELHLHDWDVDFACWCSYKYLNSGPGAVAGCFVHERHGADASLPRLAGWWGNDPDTRFRMHLEDRFIPRAGADGWQLSNPPILALAPLEAALAIFDEAGMSALRTKSLALTGYLRWLLERSAPRRLEIITPSEPEAHGAQLSMFVHERPREAFAAIQNSGCICDYREPNVVRVAPVPLYNTFHEVWRFADALTAGGES